MTDEQIKKLEALQAQLARIEKENKLLREAVKANNDYIRYMLEQKQ
jgi:hypothetical protein